MMIPYKIENKVRVYDFKRSLQYLEFVGKNTFGKKFKIYPSDKKLIFKLLIYAIRDAERCQKYNIDLHKGILLTGPVGCGKTSLMHLIRHFMRRDQRYFIKPARKVAFEFNNLGFEIIEKYSHSKKIYCFDDLGVEKIVKHYGDNCNVMAEILLSRYDLYTATKIPTHATTNLNSNELENLYGNRVRSRMRAMFNLIAFDKNVEDKRV